MATLEGPFSTWNTIDSTCQKMLLADLEKEDVKAIFDKVKENSNVPIGKDLLSRIQAKRPHLRFSDQDPATAIFLNTLASDKVLALEKYTNQFPTRGAMVSHETDPIVRYSKLFERLKTIYKGFSGGQLVQLETPKGLGTEHRRAIRAIFAERLQQDNGTLIFEINGERNSAQAQKFIDIILPVLEGYKGNPCLTIAFRNFGITSEQLLKILEALPTQKLFSLDLSDNALNRDAVEPLLNIALGPSQMLDTLILNNNGIDDIGAQAFIKYLESGRCVTLELLNNNISEPVRTKLQEVAEKAMTFSKVAV